MVRASSILLAALLWAGCDNPLCSGSSCACVMQPECGMLECGDHCQVSCSASAKCPATCGADCNFGCDNAQSCQLTCGDHCTAACQKDTSCFVQGGRDSTFDCNNTFACGATLGDQSTVRCDQAAHCVVTCEGACNVSCTGGACRVHCQTPGVSCQLDCGSTIATMCDDGWVCNATC